MKKSNLFIVWEFTQGGKASHCSTSTGSTHVEQIKIFVIQCMSANDRQSTMTINFGISRITERGDEFANAEFVNSKK